MNKNKIAVVLCVGSSGLGVVRSLHSEKIQSIAICMSSKDDILFSRLPLKKIIVDDKVNTDELLIEALAPFHGRGFVLIPSSDFFVLFMNRHRESLAKGFHISLPSKDLCESLIDKKKETRLVSSIGVSMPKTVQNLPEHPSDLTKEIALPMILKPRSVDHFDVLGEKNFILSTTKELQTFYKKFHSNFQSLLAQEIIPGKDEMLWVCHCTFNTDNDLVTYFSFQRWRTDPSHFGVTSYAISVFNEQIKKLARQFGKKLKYVGPAMIEFKYDTRDNQYKYIETNPGRIGMCNIFDTSCGVNSIYATFILAHEANTASLNLLKQKNNVIYLSLFRDVRSRYKDGESIGRILKHYASNMTRKHVGAYFRWNDPLPAFSSTFYKIQSYLKRIASNRR